MFFNHVSLTKMALLLVWVRAAADLRGDCLLFPRLLRGPKTLKPGLYVGKNVRQVCQKSGLSLGESDCLHDNGKAGLELPVNPRFNYKSPWYMWNGDLATILPSAL